jgi:hypothetical protein
MFRFTIRDVLWLTATVGLALGWWLDHREGLARASELRFQLMSQSLDMHFLESDLLKDPPSLEFATQWAKERRDLRESRQATVVAHGKSRCIYDETP